jgi:1-acyl-sn-glycerol-3-phosphate acyltransferase
MKLGILYHFAKNVVHIYYRLMFKVQIEGMENVDPKGHYVVCGNHISLQDPLIVGGFLPIEIRFMAKKELFKNPLLAKFFRGLGAFPVERDANDLKAIKTALAALKNGENLGIFPEGTRNRTYKALPVKAGMAMLAHRTQTPILPVTVDTTFKWFKPIRMVIHPPVSLEAYYGQKLSNETFEKISQDIVDGLYADMHYYREAKLDKAP